MKSVAMRSSKRPAAPVSNENQHRSLVCALLAKQKAPPSVESPPNAKDETDDSCKKVPPPAGSVATTTMTTTSTEDSCGNHKEEAATTSSAPTKAQAPRAIEKLTTLSAAATATITTTPLVPNKIVWPQKKPGQRRQNIDATSRRAMALQHQWEDMFQRLMLYKAQHGDCLVPNRYASDRQLGAWVSTQRRNFGKGVLSPQRKARLDAMGFVWKTSDPRATPWMQRYAELVDFYQMFGHSIVPILFDANRPLANWVSCQRQEYRYFVEDKPSRMTTYRIKLLNEVDFVWDALRHRAPAVNPKILEKKKREEKRRESEQTKKDNELEEQHRISNGRAEALGEPNNVLAIMIHVGDEEKDGAEDVSNKNSIVPRRLTMNDDQVANNRRPSPDTGVTPQVTLSNTNITTAGAGITASTTSQKRQIAVANSMTANSMAARPRILGALTTQSMRSSQIGVAPTASTPTPMPVTSSMIRQEPSSMIPQEQQMFGLPQQQQQQQQQQREPTAIFIQGDPMMETLLAQHYQAAGAGGRSPFLFPQTPTLVPQVQHQIYPHLMNHQFQQQQQNSASMMNLSAQHAAQQQQLQQQHDHAIRQQQFVQQRQLVQQQQLVQHQQHTVQQQQHAVQQQQQQHNVAAARAIYQQQHSPAGLARLDAATILQLRQGGAML